MVNSVNTCGLPCQRESKNLKFKPTTFTSRKQNLADHTAVFLVLSMVDSQHIKQTSKLKGSTHNCTHAYNYVEAQQRAMFSNYSLGGTHSRSFLHHSSINRHDLPCDVGGSREAKKCHQRWDFSSGSPTLRRGLQDITFSTNSLSTRSWLIKDKQQKLVSPRYYDFQNTRVELKRK